MDTSRPVGRSTEASAFTGDEGVVVARPWHLAALEAGTDFEALGGGDGEHGMGEFSFELVKHRLAETSRHIADHTDDGTTDRVLSLLGAQDTLGVCSIQVAVRVAGG